MDGIVNSFQLVCTVSVDQTQPLSQKCAKWIILSYKNKSGIFLSTNFCIMSSENQICNRLEFDCKNFWNFVWLHKI